MKKISLILLALTVQISVFTIDVGAQSLVPPASMASNVAPIKVQPQQEKADAEAQGYSMAFLAYHYNNVCKLGFDKDTIDGLLNELKIAETTNQISQDTINANVADSQRIYKEDPIKFCDDAKKIGTTIKTLLGKN